MAKLLFDQAGQRFYETGISEVALFVKKAGAYQPGVAWNGVTAVNETPSGAEATALYADNIKYLNLVSAEELGLSIEAYTYPDEFMECDGSATVATGVVIGQQARLPFGLVYKTKVGNDEQIDAYKLHIVYNCLAAPSERSYQTVNESPEAITFSWDVTTTAEKMTDGKTTCIVTIDSRTADKDKLAALEAKLYGAEDAEPTFMLPDEIITMMAGTQE